MRKLISASLIAIAGLVFGPNRTIAQQVVEDNTIYNFVSIESPPTYPGGMPAFYAFLSNNIKYPQEAKDKKIEGYVFVSFVVEKDGAITDIKVERSLKYGTDEEAVRVLRLSPKWNPGMMKGNPIRTKYNIPIKFALAKAN